MKKNKGFTLIELLAVIVILAIIALIATPIVLNLINSAKKGAFARSAEQILKASKLYYSSSLLDVKEPETITFNCSNNECISDELDNNENNKKLDIDGNVGNGKVTIDDKGNISFDLTDNSYCAYKYATDNNIHTIKGSCEENNIDVVHDVQRPMITQKSEVTTTPYTISVNYETSDDKGIKEVVCTYGDSLNKLDKKGNADLNSCLIEDLLSSHEYYYKICAIDIGLNESNPCIEGKTRTKAAIAGTPTIVASWPDTTSIKVDVSGMTIDPSDTVSYRYSVNGEVKQDWTTDSSYTYTSLTEGTSNIVLVETKATDGGDLGNIKEATIYTSKTITDTNSGYSSSSECSSSTKTILSTDIYSSVTLSSPSCSSYTSTTSVSCSTSYSTSGSCASSRTCSVSGGSGSVSFDYEDEYCEEGVSCYTKAYGSVYCSGDTGDDYSPEPDCCADDWSNNGNYCGYDYGCYVGCAGITEGHSDTCGYGERDLKCYCSDVSSCSTVCYYSGYVDVEKNYYRASYSGVVTPSITTY